MQQQSNDIPPFDERGNLPSGIHKSTIDDVVHYFGSKSLKRKQLAKNLKIFYDVVSYYAKSIYVDGSFVTSKLSPSDIDILIVFPNHIRFNTNVERRVADFLNNYGKFKLHIFVCFETDLEREAYWTDWFTKTKKDENGRQFPKGIISLEVRND
ncbi:MAG: nucleotidyltransferase domain-containing protein [Anaerolineales bacterium]|nr:nucleotidyltransferase domain-containing protein [Anaerolineales bacterium]